VFVPPIECNVIFLCNWRFVSNVTGSVRINVTFRRVRVTIVAVEKQNVLFWMCVYRVQGIIVTQSTTQYICTICTLYLTTTCFGPFLGHLQVPLA
jgi:hypothetical protein